jgi:hypothetical protein
MQEAVFEISEIVFRSQTLIDQSQNMLREIENRYGYSDRPPADREGGTKV